jgi:hypothetical protein
MTPSEGAALVAPTPDADSGRADRRAAATLLAALAALMTTLLLPLPLLIPLGLLPLPSIISSARARRMLRARCLAVGPIALLAVVARAYANGFADRSAWLVGLRIVVATLWATWLNRALPARALDRALRRLGLPVAFVELLSATRRYARQLQETLLTAWAAGALRGGLGSMRALVGTIGPVAGVVLLRSIDRSQRVADAQALRGVGRVPERAR